MKEARTISPKGNGEESDVLVEVGFCLNNAKLLCLYLKHTASINPAQIFLFITHYLKLTEGSPDALAIVSSRPVFRLPKASSHRAPLYLGHVTRRCFPPKSCITGSQMPFTVPYFILEEAPSFEYLS